MLAYVLRAYVCIHAPYVPNRWKSRRAMPYNPRRPPPTPQLCPTSTQMLSIPLLSAGIRTRAQGWDPTCVGWPLHRGCDVVEKPWHEKRLVVSRQLLNRASDQDTSVVPTLYVPPMSPYMLFHTLPAHTTP